MTAAHTAAEKRGRLAETLCVLAFIEVKARTDVGTAVESVTPAQRARSARSAEVYLQHHPDLADYNVRFDVMVLGGGFVPRRIVDAWRP